MAEHPEEANAEEGGLASGGQEASAAAISLALGKAARGGKPDPDLKAFLQEQTRMLRLQMEHLHEQRDLQLSRLRWGRFSDRVKAALQVMTALVGVVVTAAVAVMAWQAHERRGVAIEAFSVPPDFAQRGLTGQVVASEVLDRLAEFQSSTVTARPASSYANDWGGDIKVEIPETGVSIGELSRYLREWLGSETRISGEVVRTPQGLAVTARAGDAPGRRFEGPETDVDKLVGQTAEAIYAQTQPYRHAVYLASHNRPDEALAVYQRLAETGPREDRPWAYAAWATLLGSRGDFAGMEVRSRQALTFGVTDEAGAITALFQAHHFLSHWESKLQDARLMDDAIRAGHGNPRRPRDLVGERSGQIDAALGDFRWDVAHRTTSSMAAEGYSGAVNSSLGSLLALADSHDLAGARRLARDINFLGDIGGFIAQDTTGFANFSTDDWPGVERWLRVPGWNAQGEYGRRFILATLANAVSAQGRQAEAEALIVQTPQDCDICVDARAVIAARKGDWAAAQRWLDALDRRTPSIPFAPTEWGKLLLDRGDVDGAIAKLKEANRRGPHFADPLELWGEALVRKGDFAGAVAKFAEADKYAPHWGRNHLRWGQALARLGKADEAKAQWRAAAGMDLSDADRAELGRVQAPAPKQAS